MSHIHQHFFEPQCLETCFCNQHDEFYSKQSGYGEKLREPTSEKKLEKFLAASRDCKALLALLEKEIHLFIHPFSTCSNEGLHSMKLPVADKNREWWSSFHARCSLVVNRVNLGYAKTMQRLCLKLGFDIANDVRCQWLAEWGLRKDSASLLNHLRKSSRQYKRQELIRELNKLKVNIVCKADKPLQYVGNGQASDTQSSIPSISPIPASKPIKTSQQKRKPLIELNPNNLKVVGFDIPTPIAKKPRKRKASLSNIGSADQPLTTYGEESILSGSASYSTSGDVLREILGEASANSSFAAAENSLASSRKSISNSKTRTKKLTCLKRFQCWKCGTIGKRKIFHRKSKSDLTEGMICLSCYSTTFNSSTPLSNCDTNKNSNLSPSRFATDLYLQSMPLATLPHVSYVPQEQNCQ